MYPTTAFVSTDQSALLAASVTPIEGASIPFTPMGAVIQSAAKVPSEGQEATPIEVIVPMDVEVEVIPDQP